MELIVFVWDFYRELFHEPLPYEIGLILKTAITRTVMDADEEARAVRKHN